MMNTFFYSNSQLAEQLPTVRLQGACAQETHKSGDIPVLLQGVLESLIDGIMILNDQGELLFANGCAERICRQLTENLSRCNAVPRQVWRSCQALINGREEFPTEPIVIEDEIKTNEDTAIRLRARWFELNNTERPCLLVALEDQQQSAQYKAMAEAQKYGLTDRETQVWVLKRAGYTYKAIAAKLHIAEDTVKKHIKSIHSKRDGAEWLGED